MSHSKVVNKWVRKKKKKKITKYQRNPNIGFSKGEHVSSRREESRTSLRYSHDDTSM